MSEVQVCQTDYLAAEDLGGRQVTVTVERIAELPREEKERTKGKVSKDVVIHFTGKAKGMRANVTNQWAMAFLTGSKRASDWVGKKFTLTTDMDTDLENGGQTLCLRVAGSPDAAPERATAYQQIWNAGPRQRGGLVKRIKSRFRLMAGKAAE